MIRFTPSAKSFDIALLIKESSMVQSKLQNYYIGPLTSLGVDGSNTVAMPLVYGANNKVSVTQAKDHSIFLSSYIKRLGIKYILCADSTYYKVLTKAKKAEANLDKALPCALEGLEEVKVIYILNYSSLVYNPAQQSKIDLGLQTLVSSMQGLSNEIKIKFKSERYPASYDEIKAELESLHQYPELACDIEAFGLQLGKAGIGSITFCESHDSGCAFLVDYKPTNPVDGIYGYKVINKPVRKLLREFFENYQGELTFHGGAYDIKHIVWELWMDHPLDYKNMVDGVNVMTRNWCDSRFVAFLCLNSTTRPDLTLKGLGYPYAGDWGEESIKDIRKIEPFQLLRYNLTDGCVTNWVRDQYWDRMFAEEQEHVYMDFLDMQKVLLVTELHGMPMNDKRLQEVEAILVQKRDSFKKTIMDHPLTQEARNILIERQVSKYNREHKKQKTAADFQDFQFNPGSDQQLSVLLFQVMDLPVLKRTPTKEPKTDADTLGMLVHHAIYEEDKELIQTIVQYSEVSQVINTFIKAFKEGILKADGRRYLHGSFNIAKVKSGRLSSSDPKLNWGL